MLEITERKFMQKAEYRNAIRSKQLIHNAIAELLHEKPLDKITVSDVVRRANINRSTFYAHYENIPAVLNSLLQQTFIPIINVLSENTLSSEATPRIILKKVQMLLESDMQFYKKLMTSNISSYLQEHIVELALDYLNTHASSEYRIDDTTILNISFCTGGLVNLYKDWFNDKLEISLEELTNFAISKMENSF